MKLASLFAAPFGNPDMGAPSSGGSHSPGTGPGGMNAGQLLPDNRDRNVAAGVPYNLVPAYPPFVRLANAPGIIYFPKFRTVTFHGNGTAANQSQTQTFTFTQPTIIIARTAAAIDASGAALPVGRNSLDTFTGQMFRAGSFQDFIDGGGGTNTGPMAPVLGSAIFGTAAQPALIPGNGLFVENGSFMNVTVVNLIANVRVDVTLWCIEEFGPARG